MNLRAGKFFKYTSVAFLSLVAIFFIVAYTFNHSLKFSIDKTIPYQLDREGPFIALEGDSMATIHYIRGNLKEGFELQNHSVSADSLVTATVFYPLDSTEFDIELDFNFHPENTIYPAVEKIFAVSDMEGNFKTFRNVLTANGVIDENLNWNFGTGHLVLLGDFVDKGYFVTQTLWLIYKLEQEAEKAGGKVHYILGNHEINNLQGYHASTAQKYWYAANVLGLKRHELLGENSFLGRWLASKNVVEKIGDLLFVHGGLHPDLANHELSLEQINGRIRSQFYTPYFVKKDGKAIDDLLFSNKKSPAWYRGYFTDKLPREKINSLLQKFDATHIIVGHTALPKISRHHGGVVIGIDVKSPLDHLKYFPPRRTNALLIDNGTWYRVNDAGKKRAF